MAKATIIQDTEAEAADVVVEKVVDLRMDQKSFFCHFHGNESDHTTNFCPEKKRTLERMEEEKKGKNGQPHCMVRTFGTAVPTSTCTVQSNLPTHARFLL